MRHTLKLGGKSWLKHMCEYDRHPALASPEDVNRWCAKLLAEKARSTCYQYYFVRIYDFYEYLKSHCDHPHLYNPFLLAAVDYEAPRDIWLFRIDRRKHGEES
jgi:hypothetical protein